jgi:hypothetical protein
MDEDRGPPRGLRWRLAENKVVLLNGLEDAFRCEDDLKRESIALTVVYHYLLSIGVDSDLLQPLADLFNRHYDAMQRRVRGGAVRPISETAALAKAAAKVTFFGKERGLGVARALDVFSHFDNLDRKKDVKRVRDDILCGRASDDAISLYQGALDRYRSRVKREV